MQKKDGIKNVVAEGRTKSEENYDENVAWDDKNGTNKQNRKKRLFGKPHKMKKGRKRKKKCCLWRYKK